MILNRWVPSEVKEAYRIDSAQQIFAGLYVGIALCLLPMIAELSPDSPVHEFQVALVVAAGAIGQLFAKLVTRRTMRGRKLRSIIFLRAIGRSLLLCLMVSDNMWWFCAITIIVMALEWSTTPVQIDIQRAVFPPHLFGKMISFLTVEFHLAFALGVVVAGKLMKSGMPPLFGPIEYPVVIFFGVLFGWGALWIYAKLPYRDLPEPMGSSPKSVGKAVAVFSNPMFRHVMVVHMVFGFANLAALSLYWPFLHDRVGVEEEVTGYLLGVSTLSLVGSLFIWARVVDRVGKMRLLSLMSLMIIACCSHVVILFFATNIVHMVAAFFMVGVANGACVVLPIKIVSVCSAPGEVQRYWSTFLVGLGSRGVAAPLLVLWIYRETNQFRPILGACVAVIFLTLIYNEVMRQRPSFRRLIEKEPVDEVVR